MSALIWTSLDVLHMLCGIRIMLKTKIFAKRNKAVQTFREFCSNKRIISVSCQHTFIHICLRNKHIQFSSFAFIIFATHTINKHNKTQFCIQSMLRMLNIFAYPNEQSEMDAFDVHVTTSLSSIPFFAVFENRERIL